MIDFKKMLHGAKFAAVFAAALAISACANKPDAERPGQCRRHGDAGQPAGLRRQCRRPRVLRDRFDRPDAAVARARSTSRRSGCSQLYRSTPFTIEGHADERGTREYNIALGARRAQAVRDYLASRGVSANRMRTISYGKERPVAVCNDISCWSQNRRAVTVLGASS